MRLADDAFRANTVSIVTLAKARAHTAYAQCQR